MTTVTIQEAQARLPELIEQLPVGEAIVLMHGQQPVAELTKTFEAAAPPDEATAPPKSGYGCCKGQLVILSEDDDYLADFAEYM